jgi:thiamine-phosphate pyrophosphorylase
MVLLIGADDALAARAQAAGVHLPERLAHRAHMLRARHPRWLITAAAHSPLAIRKAARAGVDAVLLSTIFESRSPSAGRPIGPVRLAAIARTAPVPVYALGGVDMKNARRLLASGVVGIAAVDAFRT